MTRHRLQLKDWERGTGEIGAGSESSLGTNSGVVAQSLRHPGVIARLTAEVESEGMRVLVPTPEAYAASRPQGVSDRSH